VGCGDRPDDVERPEGQSHDGTKDAHDDDSALPPVTPGLKRAGPERAGRARFGSSVIRQDHGGTPSLGAVASARTTQAEPTTAARRATDTLTVTTSPAVATVTAALAGAAP